MSAHFLAEEKIVIGNRLTCAVTVLATYDIILTFGDEIELVWRQKRRWIDLLFWANRYLVPTQAIIAMLSALDPDIPTGTMSGSEVNNPSLNLAILCNVWIVPIVVTLTEAVQTFRVVALYHGSRLVSIMLWSLLGTYFTASVVISIIVSGQMYEVPSDYPFIYGSTLTGTELGLNWESIVWILSTVNEMVLVGLVIAKTASHVRATRSGAPLLTLILRDGCLYFLVIFALMFVNVGFHHLGMEGGWANVLVQPELCISSILCSRLFLNLRAQLLRPQIEVSTIYDTGTGGQGMEMVRRGEELSDWAQTQWTVEA